MEQQVKGSGELVQPEASAARELGWFADAFESARRNRTATGERIGAVARGTDATAGAGQPSFDLERLLAAIADGSTDGPVPLLGRTYRRRWVLERQMRRALTKRLEAHPAWPWLRWVRGANAVPLARLLSRLDPNRASTPSAFWAYCGLATVPGIEYRCTACGLTLAYPVTTPPPGSHRQQGGRKACRGALQRSRGPEQGVRAAQPRTFGVERGAYDRIAKNACCRLGDALLAAGGSYASFFREERRKLDHERKSWPSPRKRSTALRKMQKLFLSHLWLVWREALALPLTEPYPAPGEPRPAVISPWDMVDDRSAVPSEPLLAPQLSFRAAGGAARLPVEGAA